MLYYSACYTIGGVGLVLSIAQAIARLGSAGNGGLKGLFERMGSREVLYACLQISLALMLVPFFVTTYICRLGEQVPWAMALGIWAASIAGQALMVFILPRFVLSVIPDRREALVKIVSAAAAASILASFPLHFVFQGTVFFVYWPMAIIPASILYAILVFAFRGRAETRGTAEAAGTAEQSDPDRAFGLSLMAAMARMSAVSLPFMLAFDFFPRIGELAAGAVGLELDANFKLFPLLYAAFSAVYAARVIPRLGRPAARDAASDGGPRSDAPLPALRSDLEGLSERELEVARLLISGLRYSDIGDRLFISLSTVKTHVERIYRKTGARSKIGLAKALRAWPEAESGVPASSE